MSVIVPNFIALGQTVYEKSVTVFTPYITLAPYRWISWAKVHQSR